MRQQPDAVHNGSLHRDSTPEQQADVDALARIDAIPTDQTG
jgi:hypothetical protein